MAQAGQSWAGLLQSAVTGVPTYIPVHEDFLDRYGPAIALVAVTAGASTVFAPAATVTIAPEEGFESNVFAGAPIAPAGADAGAGVLSTLQTANQVFGTASAVAHALTPKADAPAPVAKGAPFELDLTYYTPPAEVRPTTLDSGGLQGGEVSMIPAGSFAQVAIGIAVALVLVHFALLWRKHA